LIIFDILVYNSNYLIGNTFQERVNLLDEIFGAEDSEKEYLYKVSTNVYRVKSYTSNFKEIFDKWTKVDLIEGVVLKRKNARLELGSAENNNSRSQLKSRKVSKNYKF
jgi:ATP-dependent DNA ligase